MQSIAADCAPIARMLHQRREYASAAVSKFYAKQDSELRSFLARIGLNKSYKNADHPVFDAQTRRRMYTFDFCALSFERHGYLAKETVSFTKKLAFCRATALGLEPSAEIRRWYGVLSCCIQRANAKILRGEPVPARSSNPPPRLLARGRDLALVGE